MRTSFDVLHLLLALTVCLWGADSTKAANAAAPSVIRIQPAPGLVEELNTITVTFSEPVTGVRAGDFLVNGVPATNATGQADTYIFSFPQPPFGPVDVTWGTLHTIVDLDDPPQRFDGGVAGATWAYELIDPPVQLSPASSRRLGLRPTAWTGGGDIQPAR